LPWVRRRAKEEARRAILAEAARQQRAEYERALQLRHGKNLTTDTERT